MSFAPTFRRFVAPAAAALALSALTAGGLPAAAAPGGEPGPGDAGAGQANERALERRQAEKALEAVQELYAGTPADLEVQGRGATLLLRDLAATQDALSAEDQRAAARILARPSTEEHDCDPGEPGAASGSRFCIHWFRSGPDAPPPGATDGIPDQVLRTRLELEKVWERIVTDGGYAAPLADASNGTNRINPDQKLDIYLSDIGGDGLYGSCTTTTPAANVNQDQRLAAYCELDDDYAGNQFPTNTPLQNLRVTAGHEFFHAVQFGYDWQEDGWFMEGTAAWVEDELFDNVDDNRQYLADSPLSSPRRPLDDSDFSSLSIYGSWIWWRHLSETHPEEDGSGLPVVVREVFDGTRATYALAATESALEANGSSVQDELGAFATANRAPGQRYEEGAAYRRAPLAGGFTLTSGKRSTGAREARLDHLTSATYALRRGAGIGRGWTVRVNVDAPNAVRKPVVLMTKVSGNGARRTVPVTLDARGVGVRALPFNRTVRAVELTLVNAGDRFDCDRNRIYSCMGLPLDDNLRTTFTARAVR